MDPWKSSDNFSRARHQELVDGLNSVLPESVAGDLNQYSTPQGRGIVGTGGFPLIPQRVPVKIVEALTPDGVYSLKIGKWKDQLSETTVLTLDDLLKFPDDANAIGFVADEITYGGHSLSPGRITFANLQPSHTDKKNIILELDVFVGSGRYPGTIRQVVAAHTDGYDHLHLSSLLP